MNIILMQMPSRKILSFLRLKHYLIFSERFCQRQFAKAPTVHHSILSQLEIFLEEYFQRDEIVSKGLPGVQEIAKQLNISSGYLTKLLKKLTGQTTQQHIHNKLIEKAKEKLSTSNLSGRGKITEINVAETVKEIRRALVDADVNFKDKKCFNSDYTGTIDAKIVSSDDLVDLMGGTNEGLNLSEKPTIILIAGLQGSGKTTFSGKLANFLKKKKSKNPLLVACDVYRPAAIDQLKVLGGQTGVPVYTEEGNLNPVQISQNAIEFAKQNKHDVIIIDTAGRLAIDQEMMNEIRNVHQSVKPTETLFVLTL
ncbi:hypothetical protein FQR65_LT15328 [Abscondita terminalis]|nr:hypothetical protein FQR65_LT15328 [Abscondita terminalis]